MIKNKIFPKNTVVIGLFTLAYCALMLSVKTQSPLIFPTVLLICTLSIIVLLYLYYISTAKIIDYIPKNNKIIDITFIGLVLLFFVIKILFCYKTQGMLTDVYCFVGWSQFADTNSLSNFYTGQGFADYPPGYIYIIAFVAGIINFLGIDPYSATGVMVITLPAILSDIAIAVIAYVMVRKQSCVSALVAGAVVLASPVLMVDSSIWKQVDSVFVLVILISFLLLQKKKYLLSSIVFGVAVLMKPLALMAGPVFAIGFLIEILRKKEKPVKIILRTMGCGVVAVLTAWVGSLPFTGTQGIFWIIEKYFTSISAHSYASINAANFFSMIGLNWVPLDTSVLFLTAKQLGTFFIFLVTVITIIFAVYSVKRDSFNILLLVGSYLCGVFTFGHSMHERYVVAGIIFLLFASMQMKNKSILKVALLQSMLTFINISLVYISFLNNEKFGTVNISLAMRVLGFFQVVLFLYLLVVTFKIFTPFLDRFKTNKTEETNQTCICPLLKEDAIKPQLKWNKQDGLFILIPTIICFGISFASLGNTYAPTTGMTLQTDTEIKVEFAQGQIPANICVFGEITNGELRVDCGVTGENLLTQEIGNGNVFKWINYPLTAQNDVVLLSGNNLNVKEIVFTDINGDILEPVKVSPSGETLFDEQQTKPDIINHASGMYFDEIYHARTAYEYSEGLSIYENTHPPLGKAIIEIGILIFGMNPFGWRFMGTLLGVLLLPLMYVLARMLFKDRKIALFCQAILLFDCMRYAQSRIATIDTPTVFFIMLSYIFMLWFVNQSFNNAKTVKLLTPLLLSGVFFGLGCATKWTGIYSGAGLAVIFFCHLFSSYRVSENIKTYKKKLINIILYACLFFVLIPILIYVLSYIPVYINSDMSGFFGKVIQSQETMFSYHTQLVAEHGYSSQWWSWPVSMRPVWYSSGSGLPQGVASTISVMGNIITSLAGTIAMLIMLAALMCGSKSKTLKFIVIGFLSQFLPWVLVSRLTFLYHFFTSVPFIILAIGFIAYKLKDKTKFIAYYMSAFVGLTAVVFIMFFPVISGMQVSVEYIQFLEWFPTWTFLGY